MPETPCVVLMQSIVRSIYLSSLNLFCNTCVRLFSQTSVSKAENPSTSSLSLLVNDNVPVKTSESRSAQSKASTKSPQEAQLAALASLKVALSSESPEAVIRHDDSLVLKNLVGCLTKQVRDLAPRFRLQAQVLPFLIAMCLGHALLILLLHALKKGEKNDCREDSLGCNGNH
jgi:hypothetical protein